MSHFFAYLARTLRVAHIAHALAIIRNRMFGGEVDPERTAVLALYHDASEVLPEVRYFMETFVGSFRLTLDELR